jgi:hypothetical protein
LAHDLFGLSISTGMVAKLERSTADALQRQNSGAAIGKQLLDLSAARCSPGGIEFWTGH